MATASDRWEVGKVLGPRGLRGELKLRLFRVSELYLSAGRLWLADTLFVIDDVRWADPHTAVVSLRGVADRSAAEALVGRAVAIEAAWFAPGEGPVEQLLGAQAVDDATGAALGLEVVGIDGNGAQDLLVLRDAEGRERLVPHVEALVPAVEAGLDGRLQIRVRAIPGLLDDPG